MGLIKNKNRYNLKVPRVNDYFIGSRDEDFGRTVNFSFSDVISVINESNENSSILYNFSSEEDSYLTEGYFNTNEGETALLNINQIIINKSDLSGTDLSLLLGDIVNNKGSIVIKLKDPSVQDSYMYFKIISSIDNGDYFDLSVEIVGSLVEGILVEERGYSLSFSVVTDQNNFVKTLWAGVYPKGTTVGSPTIQNYINTNGLTVLEDEVYVISYSAWNKDIQYLYKFLFTRGKGVYDVSNPLVNVLGEPGFTFISRERVMVDTEFGDSVETETIPLGDITGSTIEDYINSLSGISYNLEENTVYFFTATENGNNNTYTYAGTLPKIIGDGGTSVTVDDFDLIAVNGVDVYTDIITKTSDIPINDGADGTSTYVETDELGIVAFDNDYNSLDNLPTIIDPTGLEALDEGNGIGWRLIDRNPANFGNIGLNAIDVSTSTAASSTRGATGDYSFAAGQNNIASGDYSSAFGVANSATGSGSFVTGFTSSATGLYSFAAGQGSQAIGSQSVAFGAAYVPADISFGMGTGIQALSFNAFYFGQYSTLEAATTNSWVSTEPLFVLGNGTGGGTRSDAVVVRKNGKVSLPSAYGTGATTGTAVYNLSVDASGNIIETALSSGASQLSDLTDVNTSTPTNRNVLVADGVDWESRALVLADISDWASNIPTLQQVTTSGNITDTSIEVANNLQRWIQVTNVGFTEGTYIDNTGYINTLNGSNFVDIDATNRAIILGVGVNNLQLTNATPTGGVKTQTFQDASGTIALLSDITAPTTIVGITGTKAEFDTAVTDGNFMYVGDAPTAHTHAISTDITGLGTGVATALGINIGSAGAPVLFNGALGTPTSGDLTNCTFPTLNQNTTGSAATLTTTRTIWGQNFNGSANVTGALTGVTDITLSGLVDGRDIAADGATLDALAEGLLTDSSTITVSRNHVATDADGINNSTSATDVTITIQDNTTVPQSVGTILQYKRSAAGNVIIAYAGGVTGTAVQTYSLNDVITLRKTATNTWEAINPPKNQVGQTAQSATGDGTTTITWQNGNIFNFQFGAFNETFTFTAPLQPGVFILKLVQDSGGSRTATFPASVKWINGTAPTLTTTATTGTDIITFYFDGTNYFATSALNFS